MKAGRDITMKRFVPEKIKQERMEICQVVKNTGVKKEQV